MPSSFRVYVDEAGDEGFRFSQGSSEWFVVGAVVTHAVEDRRVVNIVGEVRSQLGKPKGYVLHFRQLRHEQRLPWVAKIASATLRVAVVMVHKPSLANPQTFGARHLLYRYMTRFLLERVSWYCRDNRTPDGVGDGTAEVFLSNRANMSRAELTDYLGRLRGLDGYRDVRIDWNVVAPDRVHLKSAGDLDGLQIADAVASAFARAVERNPFGFTEDRYARILEPIMYRHHGTTMSYGVKLWPAEFDWRTSELTGWLRENYGWR